MKLIVGLGNPGKKYEKTRHNLGFMAIDYFCKINNLEFKNKNNAMYSETIINNEKVIFLKPQNYMNLSGDVVFNFVNYYNIDTNDVLIIYDDKDFDVGDIKVKKGGSSGGHNGVQDIITKLHTSDIARVRIGISKNNIDLADYVLSNLSKSDIEKVNEVLPIVSDIIIDFISNDIEKVMTKYNIRK